MTRKTTLYLRDILEHMRLAERFVEGLTHEQFTADLLCSFAVSGSDWRSRKGCPPVCA